MIQKSYGTIGWGRNALISTMVVVFLYTFGTDYEEYQGFCNWTFLPFSLWTNILSSSFVFVQPLFAPWIVWQIPFQQHKGSEIHLARQRRNCCTLVLRMDPRWKYYCTFALIRHFLFVHLQLLYIEYHLDAWLSTSSRKRLYSCSWVSSASFNDSNKWRSLPTRLLRVRMWMEKRMDHRQWHWNRIIPYFIHADHTVAIKGH